jgi:antirestriction protein ArdC
MDIHTTITNKIITILERGTVNTGPRWTGGKTMAMPRNAKTGEQYRGINVLVLWAEMAEKSYASSQWLTFKQAADLGGNVHKGEKSVMCVYYKSVGKRDTREDEDKETYFLAKPFWLFNVAQIDGLPAEMAEKTNAEGNKALEACTAAEQLLIDSKANIFHGFDSAYYAPSSDKICLPNRERFTSSENYYATALHELTHWTGNESRLNRTFGKRFGDDAYAFEELVAELGAAFTVGHLGMIDGTIEAHADYVQSWLRVMKNDKKAVFAAAAQAAKACEFIVNSRGNAAEH